MSVMVAIIFAVVMIGLAVYFVHQAAVLRMTAATLQGEIQAFKSGALDRLVGDKLTTFTQVTTAALQERETVIRDAQTKLIQQQQSATQAAQQFKMDLGEVKTKIEGLRDLQTKVGELNDLLKPQQLRGELGEVIVRNLLADKLPKQYEEDFTFADGKKVEFAIRLNDRLIPIDSKLQLEDFRRLREADDRQRPAIRTELKRKVKQKIDEVKQYIRPAEGTMNFALMVIPSEAVFYELIATKDFTDEGGLYEYAQAQHVFLTSPMTFWAYLTTIAHGLKGLEIERRAEEVLIALQRLAANIRSFADDEFRKLGGHLRNAAATYDGAERTLRNMEQGLTALERVESMHQQEGVVT